MIHAYDSLDSWLCFGVSRQNARSFHDIHVFTLNPMKIICMHGKVDGLVCLPSFHRKQPFRHLYFHLRNTAL